MRVLYITYVCNSVSQVSAFIYRYVGYLFGYFVLGWPEPLVWDHPKGLRTSPLFRNF